MGGLTILFVAASFLPSLVAGGKYQVALYKDRLEAHSPDWTFERGFTVALAEIKALVFRKNYDGPDIHEVHTRAGQVFRIDSSCGAKLFDAFHRLHPEVPIERRRPGA
jgi:hypothetical protein